MGEDPFFLNKEITADKPESAADFRNEGSGYPE